MAWGEREKEREGTAARVISALPSKARECTDEEPAAARCRTQERERGTGSLILAPSVVEPPLYVLRDRCMRRAWGFPGFPRRPPGAKTVGGPHHDRRAHASPSALACSKSQRKVVASETATVTNSRRCLPSIIRGYRGGRARASLALAAL